MSLLVHGEIPVDESTLTWLRAFVREQAGIVLDLEQGASVHDKLSALATREGMRSARELLDRARRGADSIVGQSFDARVTARLHQQILEALTVHETSFFRDPWVFESLQSELFPALARARGADRSLSVWCAACSTGQEPYTLAMMLDAVPSLSGWDVRLLATDLSERALDRAREGRYNELEVRRGLSDALRARYFEREGSDFRARRELRDRVEFRRFNVMKPWAPLPRMDLVLLRNMLIYFDDAAKREVLARIRQVLRPGGYLLLGGAETTVLLDDQFTPETLGNAHCYRYTPAG